MICGAVSPVTSAFYDESIVFCGCMIRLRFMAGMRFFWALLKVGALSLLSGEGWTPRPILPSSLPVAVLRPPLEFVSNGWLFFLVTCNELYWKPSAELIFRFVLCIIYALLLLFFLSEFWPAELPPCDESTLFVSFSLAACLHLSRFTSPRIGSFIWLLCMRLLVDVVGSRSDWGLKSRLLPVY